LDRLVLARTLQPGYIGSEKCREFSDDNFRVNCVSPGIIRTRFQDFLTTEQAKDNIQRRIPLHRERTPADVGQVIVTLVGNDFISGENIVIDGGMSMRMV
jgi:NAD(P)-dependent dehydrogenase (short-subunit alcohol dehydrogenase family)